MPETLPFTPRVLKRKLATHYVGFDSPRSFDEWVVRNKVRQTKMLGGWGYDVKDLDRAIDLSEKRTHPRTLKRAS